MSLCAGTQYRSHPDANPAIMQYELHVHACCTRARSARPPDAAEAAADQVNGLAPVASPPAGMPPWMCRGREPLRRGTQFCRPLQPHPVPPAHGPARHRSASSALLLMRQSCCIQMYAVCCRDDQHVCCKLMMYTLANARRYHFVNQRLEDWRLCRQFICVMVCEMLRNSYSGQHAR